MTPMKAFAAAALILLAAGSAAAASGSGKYLADRHAARGIQCDACHTPDKKVKQSGDFDVCVDCHGDYAAMIKKTDAKYQGKVNPHAQHEGVLPCTECHKGHGPGVNYCGQCHSYIYDVP